MPSSNTARDTSIRTYKAKRDFAITREPAPAKGRKKSAKAPMFVVQKHQAHRAGLHWDFRLEHGGVLWSWAVRKGPSLDPADKRIAVHVEDHPLDYADFQGTIPDGQYGAGTVETWDRGTWEALDDPVAGMRKGELRFVLDGERLHGRFTLVRLKPRAGERNRQENWLLIKGHDEAEQAGADALAIEAEVGAPKPVRKKRDEAPAEGAVRAKLPAKLAPQLASIAEEAPEGKNWISEIKFDGYRLLIWIDKGKVRLVTRNGLDWTDRLPAVARAAAGLKVSSALLDGELVALDKKGVSSFPELQAALSNGQDERLHLFLFDLLHLDGWDLRKSPLLARKQALAGLSDWSGMLRYSDHDTGEPDKLRREACQMGLEGIICKQADAPYASGRGRSWLKVKCKGREELIVLGWTPPGGSRTGLGSLHLGYYDADHHLHYAGGVGTGFSDDELEVLRDRLDTLAADPPKELMVSGEALPNTIHWVRPELVVELNFTGWSGSGRVRHAVYLGLREDKAAEEVVREPADPEVKRVAITPKPPKGGAREAKRGPKIAVPPVRKGAQLSETANKPGSRIVTAKAPSKRGVTIAGVAITHPERELWPGITKQDLAEYWETIAEHALPGLAHRPLAIVRCPEGIEGERFFQKHGHGAMPHAIRTGEAEKQPFLAIDDVEGLVAMAQMSAIELHAWGAAEADPLHPDFIVFDLDPGEGVKFSEVVQGAHDVRERLQRLGLESFCRTTGGKGLHVVAPLEPVADWGVVKPFCRAFAEAISNEFPDRYLPTMRKVDRQGRILVDWLRNGLGATAVASFCPRARPGATVATPLSWNEVTAKLDPAKFTLRTVPERLRSQRNDPWDGFAKLRQRLPDLSEPKPAGAKRKPAGKARIVYAPKPKRKAS